MVSPFRYHFASGMLLWGVWTRWIDISTPESVFELDATFQTWIPY